MNLPLLLATVVLSVPSAIADSAQDNCTSPPLTRRQIEEVVKKDALDRGMGWAVEKWALRISEDRCNYYVFVECCPEERPPGWAVRISREGKIIKRFEGR
jgi:hypothetical protein